MYVSEFENYLRNETFLKDETVKAYLRIINKFIAQSDDFNVNDLQSELRASKYGKRLFDFYNQ